VSVLNVLSHRTLPQTDFYDPAAVMHGLNRIFTMESHGGHFFTIWYGVYSVEERKLTFSGGGHPPALLFGGATAAEATIQELHTSGPPIGMTDLIPFDNSEIQIPAFGRLLIYSDGAVEVGAPDGTIGDQIEFTEFVTGSGPSDGLMERVLERGRRLRGSDILNDDCSLMLIDFP
jgi:phosphoserine phosphatase RsbU/P